MKKLLGLLGAVGLAASGGSVLVACSNGNTKPCECEIKVEEIKNQVAYAIGTENKSLAEIQTKLDKLVITGVKKITAELAKDSKTDVTFTISVVDGYKIDNAKFVLKGVITGEVPVEKTELKVEDVKNQVGEIAGLEDLAAVNSVLAIKANDIKGVTKLTAILKEGSTTDVVVTVEIDEASYTIDSETFEIVGAIAKAQLKVEEVKTQIGEIKGLEDLAAVNSVLATKANDIKGVTKLTAILKEGSTTDVVVTVEIDEASYTIDSETFEIAGAIAKTELKVTEIKNQVGEIKDLKDLAAVNTALTAKVNDIAGVTSLTAILKEGSTTDVVVTVKIDEASYTIDSKTFEIAGAIAKTELKVTEIKNQVGQIKDLKDLAAVNTALTAKVNDIAGVTSLSAELKEGSTTDIVVTVKIDEASYTIDSKTFEIAGAIAKTELKVTEIKNQVGEIKDLKDLAAVNTALTAKVNDIAGVTSLSAELKEGSTTDVVVTVKIDEASYTIDSKTFEIAGAIAKTELKVTEIKNQVGEIKDLKDLAAVNTALTAKVNDIAGVTSLSAELKEGSTTDVVVTVKIDEASYTIDSKTFEIAGAIAKTELKVTEIKNQVGEIKDLKDLAAVNSVLATKANDIKGVTKLTAILKEGSTTDVVVTVEIDEASYTIDSETFEIAGAIAKTELKVTEIKNQVGEIKDLKDLAAVNTALTAKVNDIAGVTSLTAILKEGSTTDVVVTVKIDEASYTIDSKTFEIAGAIAKTELKVTEIKNQVGEIKDLKDLAAVNSVLATKANDIKGVTKLTAILKEGSTTDVVVTVEIDEASYTIDSETFEIAGAIAKTELKVTEIKNQVGEIKDLKDLAAVNTALTAKVNDIAGVTSLSAELKEGSTTDVVVTVKIDEASYTIDSKTFEIAGAIAKTELKVTEIKNQVGEIKDLKDLAAVNTALTAKVNDIAGVTSLSAELKEGSTTDVVVTVKIDEASYTIDSKTFEIAGAIAKTELKVTEIKNQVGEIKDLKDLAAVNSVLATKVNDIAGVTSLSAELKEGSTTDVVVTVEIDEASYTIDSETFEIAGAIAKTELKVTEIKNQVGEIKDLKDLAAVNTALTAKVNDIAGVTSLSAELKEGSTTDVVVTVEIDEASYTIDSETFEIAGAIAKTELKVTEIKNQVGEIKDLKDLAAVNTALTAKVNDIAGVTSLSAELKEGSTTDVVVTVKIDEASYTIDSKTFEIAGAIFGAIE